MAPAVRSYMPHQVDAAGYADPRDRIALFMEMRLGKTMVAIRWAETRKSVRRILVVAPLSVLDSWAGELAREGLSFVQLVGSAAQRARLLEENADARWFGINYEALIERGHRTPSDKPKAVPSTFAELAWDCVIADESTAIRSPKALVTKVFLEHVRVPYRALLSGLPNPEGPEDFVAQLLWLQGELMGCDDYWDWRARHMQQAGYGWVVKSKSLGELREIVHRQAFTLSRAEAGIGNKKIRSVRTVTLPPKVLKAVESARADFQVGDDMTDNVLEVLTWQQRLIGGRFLDDPALQHDAKIREVLSLVTGELRRDPVVVWCRFTAEIEAMSEALVSRKIRHGVITGERGKKANAETVEGFQLGRFRVLVAQPACIQMGIDLSIADVAIYFSNYFDYEIRAQSEDRIEHPKKKRPLLIIDVVAKDTADEQFPAVLGEKRSDSRLMLRNFLQRIKK